MADIEAKTVLDNGIHPTEAYPPQDLAKGLIIESQISKGRRLTTK
jgi:hypothetical protein